MTVRGEYSVRSRSGHTPGRRLLAATRPPPKSRAGHRVVGIPEVITPALREHLAVFAEDDPGALVFPGAKGGPLRRGNFNKMSAWPQAVESIGVPGLHFHDLATPGTSSRPRAAPHSGT
jgi:integrase